MTRYITVTLFKDSTGAYSLNILPLTTIVSELDEEGDDVNVKWLLRESPDNPDFPNARRLVVTFMDSSTPFTITNADGSTDQVENYIAYLNDSGVDSPSVRQDVLGFGEDNKLFKYNISVYANDGTTKLISVDPHIKVRRKMLTRDTL